MKLLAELNKLQKIQTIMLDALKDFSKYYLKSIVVYLLPP